MYQNPLILDQHERIRTVKKLNKIVLYSLGEHKFANSTYRSITVMYDNENIEVFKYIDDVYIYAMLRNMIKNPSNIKNKMSDIKRDLKKFISPLNSRTLKQLKKQTSIYYLDNIFDDLDDIIKLCNS